MEKNYKTYNLHMYLLGLAVLLTANVTIASPLSLQDYFGYDISKPVSTEYYIEKSREVPRENKVWRMIEHANKRHFSEGLRWKKYVGTQPYYDCKVHRNIDCKNPAFNGCWQCREYYMSKDGNMKRINRYHVTRDGGILLSK